MDKEARYDYSSLQMDLPSELSKRVLDWQRSNIPSDILYDTSKHGMGLEKRPHVTVKYGLKDAHPENVQKVLRDSSPVKMKLGRISLFTTNKDFDVLKVEVDSGDLHRLNSDLESKCRHDKTHPYYNPHVTLAYIKKGTGDKFIGNSDLKSDDYHESKVAIFSSKTGNEVKINLGRSSMKLAEKLASDINAAVEVKLAEFEKESRRKHKFLPGKLPSEDTYLTDTVTRHDLRPKDYAGAAAGMFSGALMNSILKDINAHPVEIAKNKIYSLIKSVAAKVYK